MFLYNVRLEVNGQFRIGNDLRNNKLTVHHATLRSHAKAFIIRLNRNSLSIYHLKNAA